MKSIISIAENYNTMASALNCMVYGGKFSNFADPNVQKFFNIVDYELQISHEDIKKFYCDHGHLFKRNSFSDLNDKYNALSINWNIFRNTNNISNLNFFFQSFVLYNNVFIGDINSSAYLLKLRECVGIDVLVKSLLGNIENYNCEEYYLFPKKDKDSGDIMLTQKGLKLFLGENNLYHENDLYKNQSINKWNKNQALEFKHTFSCINMWKYVFSYDYHNLLNFLSMLEGGNFVDFPRKEKCLPFFGNVFKNGVYNLILLHSIDISHEILFQKPWIDLICNSKREFINNNIKNSEFFLNNNYNVKEENITNIFSRNSSKINKENFYLKVREGTNMLELRSDSFSWLINDHGKVRNSFTWDNNRVTVQSMKLDNTLYQLELKKALNSGYDYVNKRLNK